MQTLPQEYRPSTCVVSERESTRKCIKRSDGTRLRYPGDEGVPGAEGSQERSLLYVPRALLDDRGLAHDVISQLSPGIRCTPF